MKADPLAYKRAASVALIGLGIQGALSLILLLYAIFGQDGIAVTAFYYTLLGIPAWITLALVFHQQRLERREAAEQELFERSSAAEISVFDEAAADFRVAATRLAWMHRILTPVVGLGLGALMVLLGLARFSAGREALDPDAFVKPEMTGWAVSVGVGVAIVGFIFARFAAGMAKQEVWSNLRAGAAIAVGASLAGLSLSVAHVFSFAGVDLVLRYMHVVLPIAMIALGLEIFLNFILTVYRPRRKGETPRPVFESRILGFAAAPDRIAESVSDAINYQFGFNVSSTWFYQLLSRSIVSLVALAALVIWGLTSLAVVAPNQKGLILQFGALQREVGSGLHWKAPWPIQTLETFPALTVNEFTVGTPKPAGDGPIIWTEPHGTRERFVLVQSTTGGPTEGTARDHSLVAVEVPVQFEVVNLQAYRMLAADSAERGDPDRMRRELLANVASRVMIEYVGGLSVDNVLGAGRKHMNSELHRRIQAKYDGLGETDPATGQPRGAGVRILFVGVAGAHPPQDGDVALAFEQVVSAEQQRQAMIAQATSDAIGVLAGVTGDVQLARRIVRELDTLERMTYAGDAAEAVLEQESLVEELLAQAGGEAAKLLSGARADRWEKHMDVRAQAARQGGQSGLYRAAPSVFMAGLYFDTIRSAVRDARVFITAFDTPMVRLNFEEIQSNISGFEIRSARE